jgi:hypothetical protein
MSIEDEIKCAEHELWDLRNKRVIELSRRLVKLIGEYVISNLNYPTLLESEHLKKMVEYFEKKENFKYVRERQF